MCIKDMQGSAKRRAPGFVNFVPAVVHHFCPAFPAAFSQPGARLLAEHCISFLIRISSLLESEYDALHFPAFHFIAPCAAIALSAALSVGRYPSIVSE